MSICSFKEMITNAEKVCKNVEKGTAVLPYFYKEQKAAVQFRYCQSRAVKIVCIIIVPLQSSEYPRKSCNFVLSLLQPFEIVKTGMSTGKQNAKGSHVQTVCYPDHAFPGQTKPKLFSSSHC